MPDLRTHSFVPGVARTQIDELAEFLARSLDLSEGDISEFLAQRTQLLVLIGHYHSTVNEFDLLAQEYPLFGEFRCDIVVGDSRRKEYAFIECEDARPNSIFVQHGDKLSRDWGPRLEHGYSQIVDWFYKLQSMTDTPDMEAKFGKRAIDYTGVLIVGRDQFIEPSELMRLEWRKNHVIVNSKRIVCVTYDQLVEDLCGFLRRFELYTLGAS